ncbi:MAG: hypothetical protein LBS03_00565 [Bacteroidales bacterium]|jgi:hypothetical protein|nr:hypothetical protein [Bacteroidales bacterium]
MDTKTVNSYLHHARHDAVKDDQQHNCGSQQGENGAFGRNLVFAVVNHQPAGWKFLQTYNASVSSNSKCKWKNMQEELKPALAYLNFEPYITGQR